LHEGKSWRSLIACAISLIKSVFLSDVSKSRRIARARLLQTESINQKVAFSLWDLLESAEQLMVIESSHEDPPKRLNDARNKFARKVSFCFAFKSFHEIHKVVFSDQKMFLTTA